MSNQAALFVTCLGDTFYPEIPASVVRVLTTLGYQVSCPSDQTCCGQPLYNAGHAPEAERAARHFLEVFGGQEGIIVAPSSSCVAMVRTHYPLIFRDDPIQLECARRVGARTYEFCEFLTKVAKIDLRAHGARWEGTVTFHRSCHFRALGLVDEPIELIEQIADLRYLPLRHLEECCGFGGTFALNYPHVSQGMVAEKLRAIEETGADWLIYADPGCALNILGYAHRQGAALRAMHIAELVARALEVRT